MTARLGIFLFVLLLQPVVFSQEINETSADFWLDDTCTLKGPVKKVEHEAYSLNGQTSTLMEKTLSEYTQTGFRSKFEAWSNMGHEEIVQRLFDADGTKCLVEYSDIVDHKIYLDNREEFQYNGSGKLIKATFFSDNEPFFNTSYVYDDKGRFAGGSLKTPNYSNVQVRRYDNQNRIIYESNQSSENHMRHYWIYDSAGRLSEETIIDSSESTPIAVYSSNGITIDSIDVAGSPNLDDDPFLTGCYLTVYRYDAQGKLVEKVEMTLDRKTIAIYTYNEFGCPSSFTNPSKTNISTMTYTYDSHGNWIEKNWSSESDGIYMKETRKITYYE